MFNKAKIKQLEAELAELKKQNEAQEAAIQAYEKQEEERKKPHPKKDNLQFAFEIDGKRFYNHYQPSAFNVVRYSQYQVALMELESGLGTESWRNLIEMLNKACNPNNANRIDLKAISYVATEMDYRLNRIHAPEVAEDIFCLFVIAEDEDPMGFDMLAHQEKKELFRKNGYLNISNDFFFEFLTTLKDLGDMSDTELKAFTQKQYMEEIYKDVAMNRIAKEYLSNQKL